MDEEYFDLLLWLSASFCVSIWLNSRLLLRTPTTLSSLTATMHLVVSSAMGILFFSVALLPPSLRIDVRILCSSAIDQSLWVWAFVHAVFASILVLSAAMSRSCSKILLLRMETCLVFCVIAHITSTRHSVLCRMTDTMTSRFIFLAMYAWSSGTFWLCAKVEEEAGRGITGSKHEDEDDVEEGSTGAFDSAVPDNFEGDDDADYGSRDTCLPCLGRAEIEGARRAGGVIIKGQKAK